MLSLTLFVNIEMYDLCSYCKATTGGLIHPGGSTVVQKIQMSEFGFTAEDAASLDMGKQYLFAKSNCTPPTLDNGGEIDIDKTLKLILEEKNSFTRFMFEYAGFKYPKST